LKTKFTKKELIDRMLLVCPQLRELSSEDQEQYALAGTVQTGSDEFMEFGDWELLRKNCKDSNNYEGAPLFV